MDVVLRGEDTMGVRLQQYLGIQHVASRIPEDMLGVSDLERFVLVC